ncbi:S8 family serine peptidase [Streptomyces tendae]|uniref:S8 family serine peptidase n=1 Tax=Streptomyces tendae TaxID=1932 RepID=UPI00343601A2
MPVWRRPAATGCERPDASPVPAASSDTHARGPGTHRSARPRSVQLCPAPRNRETVVLTIETDAFGGSRRAHTAGTSWITAPVRTSPPRRRGQPPRPRPRHPAPGYLTISGTSMATPHVAGAAAVLLQRPPGRTGRQLKDALVASTADGGLGSHLQGFGRVDVPAALQQRAVAGPGRGRTGRHGDTGDRRRVNGPWSGAVLTGRVGFRHGTAAAG